MNAQFVRGALAAGHATVLVKLADWGGGNGAHPYPLKWIAGIAVVAVLGLFLAYRSFEAPADKQTWDERLSGMLLAGIIMFWLTVVLQNADILPSNREFNRVIGL